MECLDAQELVHPYADNELDVATARQLDAHLQGCEACARAFEALRAVRAAAANPSLYHLAPPDLRSQVMAAIRAEIASPDSSGGDSSSIPSRNGLAHVEDNPPKLALGERRPARMRWWPLALAAMVLLVMGLRLRLNHNEPTTLAQLDPREVIDAHLRSLQPGLEPHLLDVVSTSQHTVKPWFDQHLDFSPPVRDLAAAGYPLIGGRVDYFDSHPVAAIVYRRNAHTINLFVWLGKSDSASTDSQRGYNLVHWTDGPMTFWAVSDISQDELNRFADLLRAPAAPTTVLH